MKALIVGHQGQDGTLLYDYLEKKGYQIFGIDKNSNKSTHQGFPARTDICNPQEVSEIIKKFQPDEVYHLAALHHSSEDQISEDLDLFQKSYQINVGTLLNFLAAIKESSPKTRLFFAASSHIFGSVKTSLQDENTPINPSNLYGTTKAFGVLACRYYRNKHSLFASAGILYNHESEYRSPNFLSKKIILAAINIKNKKQDKLILGDLDAKVDWGYAPDYIEAMYKILQLDSPDDFVIATGEKRTVKDFVEEAFRLLGLDWKEHVETDQNIIHKEKITRIGNPKKLKKIAGWEPKVDFKSMIKILLEKELQKQNEH
ncbi:MAG: GDP-mannose 4,6-dehydratase [Candidatus Margulisbacteria bacterium]|nr:GDP-mannose 4,6-dehydratase [Candidatus Margulisiibacteriota bacterium]